MKILFAAQATAIGGRNGHSEAADRSVSVDLSIPKEMGGPGKPGTTTPEHLFATGYAACFGSALDYAARNKKLDVAGASITAKVGIGQRDGGGFGLAVALEAYLPGTPRRRPRRWLPKRTPFALTRTRSAAMSK